jgi:hypothetical protein
MAENKYEPKPGNGSAWVNDRKTEDWHADYRGKILLPDGTEHWVDVWDKQKQNGEGFRTIRIGNPVAQSNTSEAPVHHPQPTAPVMAESINEMEDDLPF